MTTEPILTETESTIIGIEQKIWRYVGAKERVVREKLDLSLTRYYQQLNAMLDDPRVEAAKPIEVRRLRRIRDKRADSRASVRDLG